MKAVGIRHRQSEKFSWSHSKLTADGLCSDDNDNNDDAYDDNDDDDDNDDYNEVEEDD